MSYHVIHIDSPARLSVNLGRLKVNERNIAAMDCAVLILNHKRIYMTQSVLALLAQHGAVLLTVNEEHAPVSLSIPYQTNKMGARKPHQQALYIQSKYSQLWWRQIIMQKIQNQAFVLQSLESKQGAKLSFLSERVKLGDSSNVEGRSARIFWREYFRIIKGGGKREKKGAQDSLNQHLNYGYAIIRSLVARSFSAAGFCLNFGIGHSRMDNPFNLVEDFVEPLRYLVELAVAGLFQKNPHSQISSKNKRKLSRTILEQEVSLGERLWRLIPVSEEMARQYGAVIEKPQRRLHLPGMTSAS